MEDKEKIKSFRSAGLMEKLRYNNNYMEEMPWRDRFPGTFDDYFPDYQLDCFLIILLNDHEAQKRR